MSKPEFVYTTYIETSAEKLWHALTEPLDIPIGALSIDELDEVFR